MFNLLSANAVDLGMVGKDLGSLVDGQPPLHVLLWLLTLYHTIPTFNDPRIEAF